jgi:hypothetical protein
MTHMLPEAWAVPKRFRDRLGKTAGRSRAMSENGHILLILHEVPRPTVDESRAYLFWRTPEGAWQTAGVMGQGPATLRRLVQQYEAAVEAIETDVSAAALAQDYFQLLQNSGPVLRAVHAMHRALQDAREASGDDRELITLRDRAQEIERTLELIHEDAQNGLNFCSAKRAEEQAELSRRIFESHHRLNMLAATFLPLSAVASALSLDLRHLFGDVAHPAWVVVIGASVLLGLVLRKRLAPTERSR